MQLFMCVRVCVYIRKYRQGAHKTRWAIDTNTRHRELGPPDIYRLYFFPFFTLSTERNISTCYVVEKRVGSTHTYIYIRVAIPYVILSHAATWDAPDSHFCGERGGGLTFQMIWHGMKEVDGLARKTVKRKLLLRH